MPTSATARFSSAVGGRLPGVRLHADSDVVARVGARALTVGRHVAFAPGHFRPGTREGESLIHHELAHVVQQDGAHGAAQASGLSYDAYEAEADEAVRAVASGRSPHLSPVRDGIGPRAVQLSPDEADDRPPPFARPEQDPAPQIPMEDMIDFRNRWWANDENHLRQMFEGVIRRGGREGGTEHAVWLLREFLAGGGRARGTAVFPVISGHAFGARRGDLVQNPYSHMQREARRKRNEAAIHRLYPQIAEKATRVLDQLLRERQQVLDRFRGHIGATLAQLLFEGEDSINAEIERYGLQRSVEYHVVDMPGGGMRTETTYSYSMDQGPRTEVMAAAARDLLEQRRELDRIEGQLRNLYMRDILRAMTPGGALSAARPSIRDMVERGRLKAELLQKERQYRILGAIHSRRYPLLGAFLDDTSALERLASGHGRAHTAGELLWQRLERIHDTRRDLEDGDINLWKLDQVIEIAKRTGGIPAGSLYDAWVTERNQEAKDDDKVKDYILAAVSIVLGILAIPATGGASLALAAGSAAASATSLSRAIADYKLKRADNMADRAFAIAGDDPSSLWIALEVVGLVLDVGQAVAVLRSIKGPVKAAVEANADQVDEAIEAAVRAAEAQRPGLGRQIRQGILRQRAEGGRSLAETLGGAAGHEARAVARTAETIAEGAEDALGSVPSGVVGHQIKVTPDGFVIRCSSPCDVLFLQYADEINSSPELARRWNEMEQAARRAAAAGDSAAADAAALEARHLIDEFEAIRLAPRVRDGGLTAEDMQRLLPNVVFDRRATQRLAAVELLNRLSPTQRQQVVAALRQLTPEEAGRLLSVLGRQDPQAFADAMARRAAGAADEATGPAAATPSGAMFGTAEEAGLDEWLEVIQTTTRRIDPARLEGARATLRRRMTPPDWARNSKEWNAHHIFPVELQDHPVFLALKRSGGWDYHDPAINAIALPTTPKVALREGLPVHQVTAKMLSKKAPPGTVSLLRGHPNYNRDARMLLDGMEHLIDDPDALRSAVMQARQTLIDRIGASHLHPGGYRVLW
jgi:hypothetical protein